MHKLLILLFAAAFLVTDAFAGQVFSSSGRLDLHDTGALRDGTPEEQPGLDGRIRVDAESGNWRVRSWLEGGWDGSVQRPPEDPSLFKNFHEVYQSNSPYLEIKELYAEHAGETLDLRAGIQRFSWGRLDEYPPNDLLNPWDYTRFLRKPLEDRKIGVPSVSASMNRDDWTVDLAWVPLFVPYRLPQPDERWAGTSAASLLSQSFPGAELEPGEPDLPPRTFRNGSAGFRLRCGGEVEWALNFFHGWDPRPAFRTTTFSYAFLDGSAVIDPGYEPSFHRISVMGFDAASVAGDWSLRLEAAYAFGRYFNAPPELWGYPSSPLPGVSYPLAPSEWKSDTVEYGIGADYRLIEDVYLLLQAQQTVILDRTDALYEKEFETVLWASIKAGWMNQKVETTFGAAYNPEHRDVMAKVLAEYVLSDAWKTGAAYVAFNGPPESLFGRYSRNDQVEANVSYSW